MTLLELQDILGERIRIAINPNLSVEGDERMQELKPCPFCGGKVR